MCPWVYAGAGVIKGGGLLSVRKLGCFIGALLATFHSLEFWVMRRRGRPVSAGDAARTFVCLPSEGGRAAWVSVATGRPDYGHCRWLHPPPSLSKKPGALPSLFDNTLPRISCLPADRFPIHQEQIVRLPGRLPDKRAKVGGNEARATPERRLPSRPSLE